MIDANECNREGWDRLADAENVWTRPVSTEAIERARRGEWSVILTPNKPVPRDWFGDIVGRDVLCLASSGGQQGPILAAAGARVTVFDASSKQLARDELVAQRDRLAIHTRQGFMHDLSCFADESFDLIFHPASNCFAPEIVPVWRECFRVLRPGGALLAGFMNPDVYIFDAEAQDRNEMIVRFPLPYADSKDLPSDELQRLLERDHVLEFSHTLEDQIGGQMKVGFQLTGLFEDVDFGRPAAGRSQYMPALFATRAVKPAACRCV